MLTFEARREHYARLWTSMEVRPSKAADIEATAAKVVQFKNGRYKAVQEATGVPWYVVGIIHQLECGGNFAQHLHNGDSLAHRTHQVPAGRPVEGIPPFTWKDSAIDAVCYDGLNKVPEWLLERIAYELEKYNGWGHVLHHPEVNSPYLWSGSNHYAKGKYVADGQWSPSAVSGQSGAMPILKRVMELDPEVRPALSIEAPEPVEEKIANPALAFPKAVEGATAGAAAAATSKESAVVEGSPKPRRDLDYINEMIEKASRLGANVKNAWTAIKLAFGIGVGGAGAVTVAAQSGLLDPTKGNAAVATSWGAQHPWLMLLIGATFVLAVFGGILAVFFPKIIAGIVSAYKAGRYTPPGVTPVQPKEA